MPALTWAAEPYKQVLSESMRAKQPVIYARIDAHGPGVQFVPNPIQSAGVGQIVGTVAGGLGGGLAGALLDGVAMNTPQAFYEQDADLLVEVFEIEPLQEHLELELATALGALPIFTTPPLVHRAETEGHASAYSADPVLMFELYVSLIPNYQAVQVTAVVYEFSASESRSKARSSQHGRVYLNRFDYVSDMLPEPPVRTQEQIEADIAAVQAKYKGRKLSEKENKQKTNELRYAGRKTSFVEWREPLLKTWLAENGAKLREATELGITKVAQLLARDLLDFKKLEPAKLDPVGWKNLRDVESGRYTSLYVGGPLTGNLLSEPSGYMIEYCQRTVFSQKLSKAPAPKLCIPEGAGKPKAF